MLPPHLEAAAGLDLDGLPGAVARIVLSNGGLCTIHNRRDRRTTPNEEEVGNCEASMPLGIQCCQLLAHSHRPYYYTVVHREIGQVQADALF